MGPPGRTAGVPGVVPRASTVPYSSGCLEMAEGSRPAISQPMSRRDHRHADHDEQQLLDGHVG